MIFGTLAIFAAGVYASRFRPLFVRKLRPNCLLTRYPIVFVHGASSPFYFGRYWNQIPKYLHEHGFEIIEWKIGVRDSISREVCFRESIRKLSVKYPKAHFFVTPNDHRTFRQVFKDINEKYNLMTPNDVQMNDSKSWASPYFYFIEYPHKLWLKAFGHNLDFTLFKLGNSFKVKSTLDAYLDHCIQIAEHDFQEGQHCTPTSEHQL
ncbi:MAG: hypothetical protein KDD25_07045 [Bdellovibrionales bacterium]|nr:hypothetical protein [Bdellovibrionales bacterium]